MYYALFLDDFLNTKSLQDYKEIGRAGNSVIIKCSYEPQSEYIELSENEALSFMFVGDPDTLEEKTVRPDNHVYEILKDRPLRQVPQLNLLGEVQEGVIKYKYKITQDDRDNAKALRDKILKWIPVVEQN